MSFLAIILVPLIICLVVFFIPTKENKNNFYAGYGYRSLKKSGVTWKGFLIMVGVSMIVTLISILVIYNQNVTYKEFWNGLVIKKEIKKVDCEHSYSCNCHTECSGSGKDKSCSEYCDTCYEHDHDFSYLVYDNTGEEFIITRIDRQGINIPPRWDIIKIGDPTSHEHSYEDYIKASGDSLFNKNIDLKNYSISNYPSIYDYYKADRIIINGNIGVKDISNLQYKLSEINGKLGPKKQCNIILNIVKKQNQDYFYALQQKWKGGNKNDIIVVISVDDSNKIEWVDISCLAQSDIFRIKLKDSILSIGTLDMDKILLEIEGNTLKYYQRKRMRDFEYLKASIEPTGLQLFISIIINSIICSGAAMIFYKKGI